MDSCRAMMNARVSPVQVSKGFSYEDNVFCGEKIRGSLKNRAFGTKLWGNLTSENRDRKVKPGVAFSVLTRDINEELLVSS